MASGIYDRFKANLMNKLVDLEADAIRVALFNATHAFTSSNNVWADVSVNEITGTGYTTKGELIATPSVTQGATTKFDGADNSWTGASFTANHAVIYDDTLVGDDLIASIDFGGAQTVTAATFTIQWNANGIITLT